jgi:hypothetical protein
MGDKVREREGGRKGDRKRKREEGRAGREGGKGK